MAASRGQAASDAADEKAAANGGYMTVDALRTAQAGMLAEDDLDLPALGGKVRVRRLSLGEMRAIANRVLVETKGEGDALLIMFYTAHAALVQPRMSEADFEALVEEMPGLMMSVSAKAEELTAGLNPAVVKAAEATFRKMG